MDRSPEPVDDPETAVVVNPASGGGEHTDLVRERARSRGFEVLETEAAGDGVELAAAAVADGADRVVAAGGDGTVNEVVHGLADADALRATTVGVVPAGTGNNFAGNVGVGSVEEAFELLDDGAVRRLDLATADGRVFVNSCVAGLTAEASGATDGDLKRRWGAFAYAIATLRTLQAFDPLPLSVEAYTLDGGEHRWTGDAALVFVGNARRFQVGGGSQANAEDGLLEVLVVDQGTDETRFGEGTLRDLLTEGVLADLFGETAEGVRRLRTPAIEISVRGDAPVEFSFDGEMAVLREVSVRTVQRTVAVHVGPAYEPDPDGDGRPDG